MIKTLKGRISVIYLCLVIMIAVVGAASVTNFYKLSKAVDGLMIDNYRSISAANTMLEATQREDNAILTYMNIDRQEGMDLFADSNNTFLKWFNEESDNITENGEKEHVDNISNYYSEYVRLFSEVQEIANNQGVQNAINFYKINIVPQFNKINQEIKDLAALNEDIMMQSKLDATQSATKSMYTILVLSALAVIGGYFVSRFFTNRFLKPIYSLTETIKSVNAGNLNQKADIVLKDEIGVLTSEFNDMTKRLRQFEKSTIGKLMSEKNKSIAIVKSISDPLIVLDRMFHITLLNKACEKFFKIKEVSSLSKHFLEIIKNEELFNLISGVFETDQEYKQKIMCIKSGESEYYYNVIVQMIKDNDSSVNSIMILFQNVTELKQLERIKADFISTISHEFKTPLTSVMMAISLITNERMGPLNKKQKEILETMEEDIEKLSSLTSNLIELSKIESGKKVFNIEPCSVYNIFDSIIKKFYEQAELKNVIIHYELDKNLPMINADPEEISWVLNRLLSDALKYTSSGDEILINAFVKIKKLCISIKDTGAYISPEYVKKIFDKFIQAEGHDIEARGTGFGFAATKEIIEAHGGEIWCESKTDTGSIFTFTLPTIEDKGVIFS